MYGRAEINLSDHKPVFGLFEAKIRVIEKGKLEHLNKELIAKFTQLKLEETENQIKEKIETQNLGKSRSSSSLTQPQPANGSRPTSASKKQVKVD